MEEAYFKIKKIIHNFFPDSKVVLFGSRARGENGIDSDYDLLIIINKTFKPYEKIPFITLISNRLLKEGYISDILIQSIEEIDQKKKLTGHIIKTILEEGLSI